MTVDLARQVCLGVFSRGPHCAAHTLRGSVQYGKAPLLLPFPGADLSWWPSQTAVVQSTAEGLKSSQPFTGCAMMGTLINPSVPQFPHLCSGYSPHTHTSPHPPPAGPWRSWNERGAQSLVSHTAPAGCPVSAVRPRGGGHLRAGDRLTLWLSPHTEGFSGRVLIRPLRRCCSGIGRNSQC